MLFCPSNFGLSRLFTVLALSALLGATGLGQFDEDVDRVHDNFRSLTGSFPSNEPARPVFNHDNLDVFQYTEPAYIQPSRWFSGQHLPNALEKMDQPEPEMTTGSQSVQLQSGKRIRMEHFPELEAGTANSQIRQHSSSSPSGVPSPAPTQPQPEAHQGLTRHPNDQPIPTHREVVPSAQPTSGYADHVASTSSTLIEAQTPEVHISKLLAGSRNVVGHKSFPEYMSRVMRVLESLVERGKAPFLNWIAVAYVHFPNSLPTSPTAQYRKLDIPKILMLLEPVINWVLMYHAAFLYTIRESQSYAAKAHERVFTWLIKELYIPQVSLPVFVQVRFAHLSYDWNSFGPVQQAIIENLRAVNNAANAHRTAMKILYFWHRTFPVEYKNSKHLDEKAFWKIMNHATEFSFYTNEFWSFMNQEHNSFNALNVVNPKKNDIIFLEGKRRSIHTFQLHLLSPYAVSESNRRKNQRFFLAIMLEHMRSGQEDDIGRIRNDIVDQMMKIYKEATSCVRELITFENFPIGLAIVQNSVQRPKFTYVTRVLEKEKTPKAHSHVKRKLFQIFSFSQGFLVMLLHFSETRNHEKILNPHISFLSWLRGEMFAPEHSKPIFGTFEENIKNLKPSLFGRTQYLISQLIKNNPKEIDCEQIYTELLGLWYKNACSDVWDLNFSSDLEYWIFMAGAMSKCKVSQHLDMKTGELSQKKRLKEFGGSGAQNQ